MADRKPQSGQAAGGAPETATPILPAHIESTVQAIAQLHAQHRRGATPTQRVVERVALLVSRPRFVAYAAAVIALWVIGNAGALRLGLVPLDAPPFPWLAIAVSITALFMTTIILASQRREDELSNLREQLTLELAILSEQKTAKTIQLLEEMRRDNPLIPNRPDYEAEEMAKPADPEAVLSALADSAAEAALLDGAASAERDTTEPGG